MSNPNPLIGNLTAPRWQKGVDPKTTRSSRAVAGAIAKLRGSSPEAVDYVIACMRDENERPDLRLKAALGIINKVVPDHKSIDHTMGISRGIQTLTVEFVSGNSVTIERQHKQIPVAAAAGPVIEGNIVPTDVEVSSKSE